MHEGVPHPVFEPIALGRPVAWKYRGQVAPGNALVQIELEIVEVGRDEQGPFAAADAWLWVDGLRIYHVQGLALRIRSAPTLHRVVEQEWVLDPAVDRWLGDHRPTFTVAAAPLMWMVEVLARAAHQARPDSKVLRIEEMQVRQWLICEEAQCLHVGVRPLPAAGPDEHRFEATLSVWKRGRLGTDDRLEPVAVARVVLGGCYPRENGEQALPANGEEVELPYSSRAMFHGPAFQLLRRSALLVGGDRRVRRRRRTRIGRLARRLASPRLA